MMTAISDATPFQPSAPSPARSVHRAQRQDFSDHIPAHADSEREQGGPRDLPASNGPDVSSLAEASSPDARVPVPLHLQASMASGTRVFEWGLRVNGYLSEVVAGGHAANADNPGQPTVARSAAGPVAEEEGARVPFEATVNASIPAMQLAGSSNGLHVPADADVHQAGEPAGPVVATAAGDESFQRTLVRWVGTGAASTLYIRNFRLSPDEAKELASTLATAFGHTWPPSTRMVVNGRVTHFHPSMPSQGASPCPSIP